MSDDSDDRTEIEISIPKQEASRDEIITSLERILGEPIFAVYIEPVELTRWQRLHNHAVRMVRAPFEAVSRLLGKLQIEETKTTYRRRGDE